MIDLLREIVHRSQRNEPLAVCTLVQTRGSTPQRAGAMMLVLQDGKTLGTIGGGCVEAEVRSRALQQMVDGSDRLFSFNLNHDLGWDDGLVCGGSIEVAIQTIKNMDAAKPYQDASDRLARGEVADLAISVADEFGHTLNFGIPMHPTPTLVIAGAGHVGAALAAIVSQMDFSVIVIDDRPDLATAERFPAAECLIGPVESELAKLKITDQTYIVIVTRGHRRDALALRAVVRANANYIGLIGSKRKIVRIYRDLADEGISADALARVHAPIGLSIGAVTPAEIAVSIAAELISVRRKAEETVIQPMGLTAQQIQRVVQA